MLGRWRIRTMVVALLTCSAIGIGGYSLAAVQTRATDAEAEALLARDNAALIAEQVREACDRQGPTAAELGDLCRQAEQVAQEPAEPVAPTEEQLRPLVQDAVAGWLSANPPAPGRAPTVDEITAVVQDELERNPPPPGRAPTAEEIRPLVAEEVEAYLTAHPPPPGTAGEDGQPGADGRDGQDGADGRDGVDGVDGEPPHSWVAERCYPRVVGPDDCRVERCERVADFDPAQPRYVCTED